MEKFVMAAGTAMRYSDFGRGDRVIVLLHGYLESIEVWGDFAGLLGKKFRVICVDLPGHGFSQWQDREVITVDYMADTVATLLGKLGVSRITVVGHSMGGYVAISLADRYRELVEGLVLFHSSPLADLPEKREFREREIAAVEAGKKELLATINPGKGFAPSSLRRCEAAIDELSEQIMMTEDQAIIATLKGLMERPDRSEFFAKTTIPTLMVFGRWDNYISVEVAQKMVENYPNAESVMLENSGHNGFIEEPEVVLEALEGFVLNKIG